MHEFFQKICALLHLEMWGHIMYNIITSKIPQWGIKILRQYQYKMGGICMSKNEIRAGGKYAEQRRTVLENHAPDMYEAMIADDTLEAHLADMQEIVSNYVETQVEAYKSSKEYLAAEQNDSLEAMRLLNMAVLEAEDTAYRIWIANIPESDEEDDD